MTDPGDHLVKSLSIAANSAALLVADGNVIQGGLSIRAFSGTASAINITGHVLRVA